MLVLAGGFTCQAEAVHRLEAGGHHVVALDHRRDEPRFLDDFRRVLLEQRPDLVVDVNLKGLIHPEAMTGLLGRLGIPLAAWFVDSPEFILDESVPLPRDLTRTGRYPGSTATARFTPTASRMFTSGQNPVKELCSRFAPTKVVNQSQCVLTKTGLPGAPRASDSRTKEPAKRRT